MRFIVRPLCDPETTLDLTDTVVDAISGQLSAACGGNAVLNRLEAAAHLESLLRRAAADAHTHGLSSVLHPTHLTAENLYACDDSDEAHRDRQPEGFVVRRLALERAG